MSTKRKIFVLRHGERVDYLFGNWFNQPLEDGEYKRWDLNMPKVLPSRPSWRDWFNDTPITNIGHTQAKLVGESMQENNIQLDAVYVSPAFRCVQTATSALQGLGCNLPLRIEPGFFEWLGFLHNELPSYFEPQQLAKQGFNIDVDYKPKITLAQLEPRMNETFEELYDRNSTTLRTILAETTGNILIVAHAISLDTCTRQLAGKPHRQEDELTTLFMGVGFCGMVMMENEPGNVWTMQKPPSMPISSVANKTFDWEALL